MTTDETAQEIFRDAVAFIRDEYGDDAELKYPALVHAYIAARGIVTCREVELVEVQQGENPA
jgi:hypothetical protein